MHATRSRNVHVALTVTRVVLWDEDVPDVPCPGCGGPMLLHQPDMGRPTRLLATCARCECWATVDLGAGELTMAVVPHAPSLVEATPIAEW